MTKGGTNSVVEEFTTREGGPFTTHNVVTGQLLLPKPENTYATPPNFHSYTIGQLLTPLEQMFVAIQRFTNALRAFGSGIIEVINKIYEFLNDMIDELRKLVINSLQTASGRPPNSLEYSAGIMMMGGAAAIDPLAKLLGSSGAGIIQTDTAGANLF